MYLVRIYPCYLAFELLFLFGREGVVARRRRARRGSFLRRGLATGFLVVRGAVLALLASRFFPDGIGAHGHNHLRGLRCILRGQSVAALAVPECHRHEGCAGHEAHAQEGYAFGGGGAVLRPFGVSHRR